MLLLFALIVTTLAVEDEAIEEQHLTGQALVDYVRTHQNLFEVEESEKNNERMKHLMPMSFLAGPKDENRVKVEVKQELPKSFIASDYWTACKEVIKHIRDQSRCGSCWAVSAAETMSDRLCVQSEGKIKLQLSDTDILSCCGEFCGRGCRGGWPLKAWEYVRDHGVCTGGRYGTKGVCKPYAFHPCGKHKDQPFYECPPGGWPTPKCRKACKYGYSKRYEKDKYYAKNAYLLPNDEAVIRQEILDNGPVQAAFAVYEDFKLYKGGIYKHTKGKQTGAHAVKIIGWGSAATIYPNGTTVETPYWLIANSWNIDWGEGGYFRMIRGENDCELEENVYAGIMGV